MSTFKPSHREAQILTTVDSCGELSASFAMSMGFYEPDFRSLLIRKMIQSDYRGYSLTAKGIRELDAAWKALESANADDDNA